MRHIADKAHDVVTKSGTAVFIGLLITGHCMQTSSAGELAYGIGYIGEYSDNIRRTPTAPRSEWINSAIAGAVYQENGPALDAHMLLQAEYRDYRQDEFKDGPLYFADTSLLWRISPQRLSWSLVDRYSQVTRDVTRPDTPDNRVNANVFSTGPDLSIRLGQVNTLVLGLRYGNAVYNEGDRDNNRYGGSARWQYAATSELTYSLNYETEAVKFGNATLNENTLRQGEFIRIDRHQARSSFVLDLGATQIERDRTGKTSGHLARLAWSQQLTSASSAGVVYTREYQDAETALLSTATNPVPAPGAPAPSSATNEATNNIFYTKRLETFYNRIDGSYGMGARVFIRNIDYIDDVASSQDRQETGGRIDASYNPSGLLSTTAYGSYTDLRYQNNTRDDQESVAGIRFLYRLSRILGASLEGRRTWRNSNDALREYTDNRVLVALQYSSSALYSPTRR